MPTISERELNGCLFCFFTTFRRLGSDFAAVACARAPPLRPIDFSNFPLLFAVLDSFPSVLCVFLVPIWGTTVQFVLPFYPMRVNLSWLLVDNPVSKKKNDDDDDDAARRGNG